jgi:tetratricopeptide (TPR) repeat protein
MGRICIVLVALAVAMPSTARADDIAGAKEHFRRGTIAYDTGHYIEAAKEYEAAFRDHDDGAFLFNIAQAYRLAGDHANALQFYRSFLRRVPDAPNRTVIEARIAELKTLIEQEDANKKAPPEGANAPASSVISSPPSRAPASATAPLVVDSPAPLARDPERRPVYKRAWFWGVVGGAAVAVALGVGLGVGLSSSTSYPAAPAGAIVVRY